MNQMMGSVMTIFSLCSVSVLEGQEKETAMHLTEAEKIERHRMFTVPAHQRNTDLGPEIIPQIVL